MEQLNQQQIETLPKKVKWLKDYLKEKHNEELAVILDVGHAQISKIIRNETQSPGWKLIGKMMDIAYHRFDVQDGWWRNRGINPCLDMEDPLNYIQVSETSLKQMNHKIDKIMDKIMDK